MNEAAFAAGFSLGSTLTSIAWLVLAFIYIGVKKC